MEPFQLLLMEIRDQERGGEQKKIIIYSILFSASSPPLSLCVGKEQIRI